MAALRIYFILWIIGGILIIAGISVYNSSVNSIQEKYPDMTILISDEHLEAGQSVSSPILLNEEKKMILTISTDSESSPVYFSFTSKEGLVHETIFTQFLSYPVFVNSTGTYIIELGNMGTQIVSISGVVSEEPILEDLDFLLTLGIGFAVGSLLILIAIVQIIIGIVLFVIRKRGQKTKSV